MPKETSVVRLLRHLATHADTLLVDIEEDDVAMLDGDLESVVMRYQHGDCHILTAAIKSVAMGRIEATPVLFLGEGSGIPIHSAIRIGDRILDAGGIWSVEAAIEKQSQLARRNLQEGVRMEEATLVSIIALTDADVDELADALEEMELVAEHLLGCLPTQAREPAPERRARRAR